MRAGKKGGKLARKAAAKPSRKPPRGGVGRVKPKAGGAKATVKTSGGKGLGLSTRSLRIASPRMALPSNARAAKVSGRTSRPAGAKAMPSSKPGKGRPAQVKAAADSEVEGSRTSASGPESTTVTHAKDTSLANQPTGAASGAAGTGSQEGVPSLPVPIASFTI